MADHIAAAQRYRARAAKCELSAKSTSSAKFGECYRLLAQHYLVLANLEEDCANRRSPFARQEAGKAPDQAPPPLGRSPNVCSAAIANGGTVLGNGLDAADAGYSDSGRRIRSLNYTPQLCGFAAGVDRTGLRHRTAQQASCQGPQ